MGWLQGWPAQVQVIADGRGSSVIEEVLRFEKNKLFWFFFGGKKNKLIWKENVLKKQIVKKILWKKMVWKKNGLKKKNFEKKKFEKSF